MEPASPTAQSTKERFPSHFYEKLYLVPGIILVICWRYCLNLVLLFYFLCYTCKLAGEIVLTKA